MKVLVQAVSIGCDDDRTRTLPLLKDVAAEEVDLVVGIDFISCNGLVVIVFASKEELEISRFLSGLK